MNIAELTIKNTVISVIVILLMLVGGWTAYQSMPRFEDPEFTIRTAVIYTQYPGASPKQVAEEVTSPLEKAIKQLQEVDVITSKSRAGVSEITVDIKYEFSPSKADLQLIWTKLRNKIKDAESSLPPGTQTPIVNDDFGDVYGLYYSITGEGYTPAELKRYAKSLQDELLQVEGVAKVALSGALQEAIFVEISREDATSLGVSLNTVYQMLQQQNTLAAAGDVVIGEQRITIDPSGGIDSVEAIKNLVVSTNSQNSSQNSSSRLIYLKDIAYVWRGYQTPPRLLHRYNGQAAISIGIAGQLGSNIVAISEAIDKKIKASESRRPLGVELHEYYHQGNIVDLAVQDFVVNVIVALAIVIVTLFIFMGFKSAVVIGGILLLTIAATLTTMSITDIPMHRISLGALIIALGMMVDNAIVVTEGILIGVQQGRKKLDIAKEIVTQTKWPLLGGTLVGIIAFAPIGFAPGSTAEFTGHLFWVILISLLYSWLFAITLTPLFCYWLFKEVTPSSDGITAESAFFRFYKQCVQKAIAVRWLTVTIVVGVFLVSAWGFQFVKEGFFPASTTPQVVVDYWLPEGTNIATTQKDIEQVETFVKQLDGVTDIQTSIGAGGIRFMLVYSPESANESYGQLLVKVDDYKKIDTLIPQIQSYLDTNYVNAQAKVWRFQLGPGGGSKIEATFKGPDPIVLRQLANQAKAIMIADGRALSVKDDWRQQVSIIEPQYSEIKGRRAGVSREDLAAALQTNFSGRSVGVYREGDELIPIISRAPADERLGIDDIRSIQVLSSTTGQFVPIQQVVDGFNTVWRDGVLRREDRLWTIKAQSDPFPNELASSLHQRLRPAIESISLPDGYTLEWDGEYGDSKESNENLASTLPLGLLAMVLVVFVLFGKVRQPVIIWLVVPLAIIGVVIGLLVMGLPMEFMAILGVLSLSGLLIKNAIVLVDQIDFEINKGKARFTAIIDSAASRVRPVMMGTLTTVLGVLPLYLDAFFQSMSIVLIFGLLFATVLTLIVVPVLYSIFFNIKSEEV
ncbi:MAG: efflux RND transporter permease subunit [Cellvibrionaceae bacterium]